jgi:hypothetical protein
MNFVFNALFQKLLSLEFRRNRRAPRFVADLEKGRVALTQRSANFRKKSPKIASFST